MFWYVFISILMLYPFLLVYVGKKRGVQTEILALQISCAVLFFFMAVRSEEIGVDTKYYCYVFEQLREVSWLEVPDAVTYGIRGSDWALDLELGYRMINKLIGCFVSSTHGFLIVDSCIIMFLLYNLIRKQSKDCFLSIWLYLTLGIFQTEMNVSRNAVAILICYHALKYVKQKKFLKYVLFICLAALIHKSSILFIPLYFILKRPFCSIKNMCRMMLISVAAGIGFMLIGSYIQRVIPWSIGQYLMASNEKTESLLVGGLYLAIVAFIWFMAKKNERQYLFAGCPVGAWMFTFNICCYGLNIGFKMAARLAALFGTYMIIFVPDLIDKISGKKRKNRIVLILVFGCLIQYFLRMMINNIGGTMPYSFYR